MWGRSPLASTGADGYNALPGAQQVFYLNNKFGVKRANRCWDYLQGEFEYQETPAFLRPWSQRQVIVFLGDAQHFQREGHLRRRHAHH